MKVNIGPYMTKPNRKRKISVNIDDYDLWNMDSTLAYIIAPMLNKLKESKGGVPHVDDCDLSDEILINHPDIEFGKIESIEVRWNYILDAMIFSFNVYNIDWGKQFLSNGLSYNKEEADKFEERIDFGLRMFGKYFRTLWT